MRDGRLFRAETVTGGIGGDIDHARVKRRQLHRGEFRHCAHFQHGGRCAQWGTCFRQRGKTSSRCIRLYRRGNGTPRIVFLKHGQHSVSCTVPSIWGRIVAVCPVGTG